LRSTQVGVLALLALSALAVAAAPAVMPDGYSWTSHAISESSYVWYGIETTRILPSD
jgi:hypothetical protein